MRLPLRAKLVIALTILGGAFSSAVVWRSFAPSGLGTIWILVVFIIFLLASWLWPIVMYQGASSQAHHLDEGLFLLLVLVIQPTGVVLAFAVATALAQAVRRRSAVKSVFNLAAILLSVSAGIATTHLIAPPGRHLTLAELGAGAVGAAVYFFVNSVAVASILSAIGTDSFRHALFDGIEIRALLLGASVSIGVVGALAVSSYPMAAVLTGLPFWAFRQTLAGHYRARHDRTRLRGLFDATLDVNRTMGSTEVTQALTQSAAELLRADHAAVLAGPHEEATLPGEGAMSAPMSVRGDHLWLAISGRSRSEPFDEADRALLDALAAVGSGALENASLYDERRRQQESLTAITSSLGEGVCAFDSSGRITFLNPAAEELLGWSADEMLDQELGSLSSELAVLVAPAQRAMETATTIRSERGMTFRRRNGDQFPVEFTCSPIRSGAGVDGAVVAFRDISDHIAFEEQLAYHAFHDALTGLPNRRLFLDRLQHALDRGTRSGELHAVLFVDVDRFKVANDSLGHQAGDELLITIADRLSGLVREGDTLARFGGDEFTLLIEDVGAMEAAESAAMEMLNAVRAPVTLDSGRTVMVSVSIGVALALPGVTSDDVLHDADVAMYRAKRQGAGQHALYDSTAMDARSAEWIDLEVELRLAIERGELTVYYQPLFSTHSRGVVGAEALVRWQHAERGLLQPSHFITLAEDTGLILPLGRFVLEEATTQAKHWSTLLDSPFSISVNLSARQFQANDLADQIRAVLASSGLEASQLCLEITESLAHFDIERSIDILTELKSLGVELAIDDFGTGYSSLSYLKRFPVDVVKLDGSFVQDLAISTMDRAIVAAIVELARTTGMTAVAEGVETADQLEQLEQLGCPVVQGYYLGRPIPASEFTALVLDRFDRHQAELLGFVEELTPQIVEAAEDDLHVVEGRSA